MHAVCVSKSEQSPATYCEERKTATTLEHHTIPMPGVLCLGREATMATGKGQAQNTARTRATTAGLSAFGAGDNADALAEHKPQSLAKAQAKFTRGFIVNALHLNYEKRAVTARYLCLSREGLYKIMKRLGIE